MLRGSNSVLPTFWWANNTALALPFGLQLVQLWVVLLLQVIQLNATVTKNCFPDLEVKAVAIVTILAIIEG